MKTNVKPLEFLETVYVNQWDTVDLYKDIIKKAMLYFDESNENKDTSLSLDDFKNMKSYYIKIQGYYPESLVNIFDRCDYCPHKKGNNNHFLLEKEINNEENKNHNILILKSKYWDFRSYEIEDCYLDYERIVNSSKDSALNNLTKITFYYENHNILYRMIRGVGRYLNIV